MSSKWYAVQTRPHAENRAAFNLNWQGYECFVPLLRKTVRHARRSKTIMTPFFPRYIFVSIDLERDRWRSINGTIGVSHLVMFNDRPAHLPEGFVENFMDLFDGTEQTYSEQKLEINQTVRFRNGPFSELICNVQKIDAKGRVKVLLELMGRSVHVATRSSKLIAVN